MRSLPIILLVASFACIAVIAYDVEIIRVSFRHYFSRLSGSFKDAPRTYMNALELRPLSTKCGTALVLFSISDLLAQLINAREGFPSFLRTLRFAIWGTVVGAPLLHVWYGFLGNFFTGHVHLGLWADAFLMSSVDQTFFFPTYASLYFLYAELTTGGTYVIAYMKLRRELFQLVARASLFWVPSNTVNFAFSPPSLRVPIVCALSIIWNTYFSFATSRAKSGLEYDAVEGGHDAESEGEAEVDVEKGATSADQSLAEGDSGPTGLSSGFDLARGGPELEYREAASSTA